MLEELLSKCSKVASCFCAEHVAPVPGGGECLTPCTLVNGVLMDLWILIKLDLFPLAPFVDWRWSYSIHTGLPERIETHAPMSSSQRAALS